MSENKRTNDPKGVRRRIVDAAYDAFVTQGYLATGMLELREKASVSGGAMAHHFPAKRDLGLAVIRDRVAGAVQQTWIEPLRACEDTPAAIDLIFKDIIAELTQKGGVSGCPLNNMAIEVSQHDAEMRELVSAVFGDWHEALSASFKADVEAKRAQSLDPQKTAMLVVAAYSGAMAMAKARQEVSPLNDCRTELAALLAVKYRRP
ncbi:TetR family transcriptional regulator protein [Rhizobium phaseoli]|uniref:TetR/AcrR family transcriptional regulator n=2 Tax=Rhizobium phaseoli TaxID=396 RepID=UPI0007E95088|nr:TetR/AcrR family transcriptional regulator [Rhizobium phaseoli]ANL36285.1 TetR family transcriptional regulator protein [Rhizobium phaseoli]ANL48925.1 TetR family transcriptional regulator protein [Rhizobium phaseoli]ANM00010.1 TetR family transcriptional regulator protein [Rhizobium phaseoli]PDS30120.1 TetR/AcrR family transcriptional regulator [Rhizobium phaseoli]